MPNKKWAKCEKNIMNTQLFRTRTDTQLMQPNIFYFTTHPIANTSIAKKEKNIADLAKFIHHLFF